MSDDKFEPDMTNKLGLLRRNNVLKIFEAGLITKAQLGKDCDISTSTMNNCFGKNDMKTAPSNKTIGKIEMAYGLEEGALDDTHFDASSCVPIIDSGNAQESESEGALPVTIELISVLLIVGRTNIKTEMTIEEAEAMIVKMVKLSHD